MRRMRRPRGVDRGLRDADRVHNAPGTGADRTPSRHRSDAPIAPPRPDGQVRSRTSAASDVDPREGIVRMLPSRRGSQEHTGAVSTRLPYTSTASMVP
jgi:hypothetical protein